VKDLKNMGIWEKVRESIIESQGDIADIPGIPQHVKDIYKTSFTTSPQAFVEVAARAQKWIDQAISRNMYLETRDIDETMKIYTSAWEMGVKTTYYLHMKPRHTAEQSTVRVNKAEKMGKVGFAGLAGALSSKPASFSAPLQKSLDISEPAPAIISSLDTPAVAPITLDMVAPQAAPAPVEKVEQKQPVASSYQSLSSLAQAITKEPVATSKPKVIIAGNKTCPTDPADLAQCDSCQ
jgi:ribonucleoside-diphosphate reductase alpha chain